MIGFVLGIKIYFTPKQKNKIHQMLSKISEDKGKSGT
jgi:hypothetical protein